MCTLHGRAGNTSVKSSPLMVCPGVMMGKELGQGPRGEDLSTCPQTLETESTTHAHAHVGRAAGWVRAGGLTVVGPCSIAATPAPKALIRLHLGIILKRVEPMLLPAGITRLRLGPQQLPVVISQLQ